jgi:hypothetical protein
MKRRQVQEAPIDESESETEEEPEEEFEYDVEEEDEDEEYTDMADLLQGLLSTESDNVCTAMLRISSQLETTNKLLVKLISQVTKKPTDE